MMIRFVPLVICLWLGVLLPMGGILYATRLNPQYTCLSFENVTVQLDRSLYLRNPYSESHPASLDQLWSIYLAKRRGAVRELYSNAAFKGLSTAPLSAYSHQLDFSPDGQHLLLSYIDNRQTFADIYTMRPFAHHSSLAGGFVTHIGSDLDQRFWWSGEDIFYLAAPLAGPTLQLMRFDVAKRHTEKIIEGILGFKQAYHYVVFYHETAISLLDLASGQHQTILAIPSEERYNPLTVTWLNENILEIFTNERNRYLFTPGWDTAQRFPDLDTGDEIFYTGDSRHGLNIWYIHEETGLFLNIQPIPPFNWLFYAEESSAGSLRLYRYNLDDQTTSVVMATLPDVLQHVEAISLSFSPDGKYIAYILRVTDGINLYAQRIGEDQIYDVGHFAVNSVEVIWTQCNY